MVPGTNILTDIAAKQPIVDAGTQLCWNRIAQFNRQIANALRRIEYIRLRKRLRRTSIKAVATCAAVIGRKLRIHYQI